MPGRKYIKVHVEDQELDLPNTQDFPIALSYKLEDPDNFQTKKSGESLNIVVPATVKNDKAANTFHNPSVEDLTPDKKFGSFRRGVIEANGNEILVGKALLTNAGHDRRPIDYEFDFYGDNADWIIDLQDATLFDFLKQINFTFTKQKIIDSWGFDGTDETLPFVFAPVRYGQIMDDYTPVSGDPVPDRNMKPEYMRPAISKYWIIYWAFKSLGYKISSDFFDTPYFRRQVMPWTWGNYLVVDGQKNDNLDFLAKSDHEVYFSGSTTGFWDLFVTNITRDGAFNNNGVYTYDSVNKLMKWKYPTAFSGYGSLEAHIHLQLSIDATAVANSDVELRVQWFRNGVRVMNQGYNDNGNGSRLVSISAGLTGRQDFIGPVEEWFVQVVDPGDEISAKFYLHTFDSSLGRANIRASVLAFELDYLRIPIGGLINFNDFTAFQNYKFLDFLSGVVDEFNLSIGTDPVNKVITIEPTHDYSLTNDLSEKSGGYFNGKHLDWENKQDISKRSDLSLYNDIQQELLFKYKDDTNDGILKKVQDRYVNILSAGKYVFPDRFQASEKTTISNGVIISGQKIENRFFSPTMHYDVDQWKGLGSDPGNDPQMVCLVPENVSNTSADEAQNTFSPKSCYYKGLITDAGWIFDNVIQNNFPFMFAVNYKPGGENDPILSYCDERIGTDPTFVIGKGLLKRFFWQRLAIMRNGQYYSTWFKLNNTDIQNLLHREHIIARGQKWELIEIKNYKPTQDETTQCSLRKWTPISLDDFNATYPSANNVLDVAASVVGYDLKYAQLKCLQSDISITQ